MTVTKMRLSHSQPTGTDHSTTITASPESNRQVEEVIEGSLYLQSRLVRDPVVFLMLPALWLTCSFPLPPDRTWTPRLNTVI